MFLSQQKLNTLPILFHGVTRILELQWLSFEVGVLTNL